MATSSSIDPGRSTRRTPFEPCRSPPGSLSRYDLTLLVIPLVFLCAFALRPVLPVPSRLSVVVAGLCGAAVVADALYLNPPTDG